LRRREELTNNTLGMVEERVNKIQELYNKKFYLTIGWTPLEAIKDVLGKTKSENGSEKGLSEDMERSLGKANK
jgi:hypothetical protein